MQNIQRFKRVFYFIDGHLDENLSMEKISAIAHYSPFHFHRLFTANFDLSLHQYIQRVRFKKAIDLLMFRHAYSILDIAFLCGYQSSEAFSRAFKQMSGVSPRDFRRNPPEQTSDIHQALHDIRKKVMLPNEECTVKIVDFVATNIAVLTHRGPAQQLGSTIGQFIQWRKSQKLHPSKYRTFNIVYGDPTTTPPEKYRFDIATEIPQPIEENDLGVFQSQIPAGRCAVVRHVGSDVGLDHVVRYLYGEWLNESEETPRDFPLFFERVNLFPEVNEHELITDVYLPIA